VFQDRDQAAIALAEKLGRYRGTHPLVLGIPRGAVPMAKTIAGQLDGTLDVILVRKLRAPGQPELAIGAVDESGWTYLAEDAARCGATPEYIASEKQTQLKTLHARRALYTPGRAPVPARGRTVIVVDDGLATGATMRAALHALRASHPARLVCAVPVAPSDTLKKIRPLADEVVCLEEAEYFQAVGQFYRHFPQVEDAQVLALLRPASGA
jgi:putative phosphoribosyl transferase